MIEIHDKVFHLKRDLAVFLKSLHALGQQH